MHPWNQPQRGQVQTYSNWFLNPTQPQYIAKYIRRSISQLSTTEDQWIVNEQKIGEIVIGKMEEWASLNPVKNLPQQIYLPVY